jgi:hypothetical protein
MLRFSPPGECESKSRCVGRSQLLSSGFLAFISIVKSLKQNKTNSMVIFDVPLPIVRSGVLRQGSDKFYSVSFQARLSFFVYFVDPWLA